MMQTEPISQKEVQQYREEGWVYLGKVMDDHTLEAMRREEARFRGEPGGQLTIFRNQLAHYSQVIRDYICHGPQVALAGQLIQSPNTVIWFNQFVTKLPDASSGKSEFPWHQDNGYGPVEPATNVTIWVALDDVDEQNGCVWVMPKSHVDGVLDHKTKSADTWHLTLNVEGDGIPAKLRAGEAVAFTGLTLHRSKLNYSDKPRRAFFMEYADARSTYQKPPAEPQPMLNSGNTWVVQGQAEWVQK